ncbi:MULTISPECIES: tyrosine-type recombinase/integrase [Actinomycetes]|uniref:tyrosine-type recombinase/integrase n=1 Tax=Actinomycetes TaxID=1760 RepID=UPI000D0AA114|nr:MULTISPECIES: tyrosine-type recombinase/integrase [Actinomycetes]
MAADKPMEVCAAFLSDFQTHLRASTNKHDRPYQEKTITAYSKAVRALMRWMEGAEWHGDFLSLNVPTLNTFFRAYFNEHGQGGTNTLQRNLRPFFNWLEEEYEHPHPYKDRKFQKYAPVKGAKPRTLSGDFVDDMLRVTGGGHPRVKDFERVRDHAIIRVLLEGLRAEELLTLEKDFLFLEQGLSRVVPLKDARAAGEGRIIPLQPKTVVALTRYLRVRETHKLSKEPGLWLGTRGRAKLTYSGLYRMLKRRAEQAGYEGTGAHPWRNLTTHELLESNMQEGDIMTVMGWKDSTMLRLYASDMATERAVKSVRALGDRH